MTTIPISAELEAWLMRAGMRSHGAGTPALHGNGNGASAGKRAQPRRPTDREEGQSMGMGKTGSLSPRQVGQGGNVKNTSGEGDFGEPFPRNVDDTMAKAMSRGAWRVVRSAPLLMVLTNE